MFFLVFIFYVIFLYINFLIVISDIKNKIIPNKYLFYILVLLPLYYIILFFLWFTINYFVIISFVISFVISFILYYFWIWASWDAKYLLVLSLYLVNVGIIPFIWNIAILTLLYLLLYFIYFYVRIIFSYINLSKLVLWVYVDLKDWYQAFIKHATNEKKDNEKIEIIKKIVFLILMFFLLRLARLDFLQSFNIKNFFEYLSNFGSYFILFWVILGFLSFYIIKLFIVFIIKSFKNRIINIFNKSNFWKFLINRSFVFINTLILFILLLLLIIYYFNKYWTTHVWIMFYFIIIYFIFILLRYSYKITFYSGEKEIININRLNSWDIIDKNFLIKMFWYQIALWNHWNKDWILYPEPFKYFQKIENPINEETKNYLIQIYNITNNYHIKNKTEWYVIIDKILKYKTFSFWVYIFLWFIITFLLSDNINKFILNSFIKFFLK